MTLRRALYASPLALLVAVFAHILAFGFGHAPGAERSSDLLGSLGAALALGVAGAFASGLLADKSHTERTRTQWYGPLLLAAAGTVAFGCIELAEGHLAFEMLLRVACASIPLAYGVARAARSTRAAVRAVGVSYGDYVSRTLVGAKLAIVHLAREIEACAATCAVALGLTRGRAPPVLI